MTATNRIVVNTLATYARSLIGLVVGLFSMRWVLAALGQSDFGLYCVVGSLISFVTFFNGILGVSIARYYAYSIGRGIALLPEDALDDIKRWFNTSLSIHIIIPLCLVVIGYPIGAYAIRHLLTIPVERIETCVWVFRITLVTAFVNMSSVPFLAMYTARQLIMVQACFGLLGTIGNFIGAWVLLHLSCDRLIAYAVYMMVINAGLPLVQVVLAMVAFPACRLDFSLWGDRIRLKELLGFTGWTLFGGGGSLVGLQGNVMVTNYFFGPSINASYGISNQIVGQTNTLANALMGAILPAITTREGSGDHEGTMRMAFCSGKFGAFLILIFAVPLTLELPNVISLWLGRLPEYVVPCCTLALITSVVNKVSLGQQAAISAKGRIAWWQMTGGTILMLGVPMTLLLVTVGTGVLSAAISSFIISIGCCISNLFFAKHLLGMGIWRWLREVVRPLVVAVLCSAFAGGIVVLMLPQSFLRICLTTVVSLVIMVLCGWYVVLESDERAFLVLHMSRIWNRFHH